MPTNSEQNRTRKRQQTKSKSTPIPIPRHTRRNLRMLRRRNPIHLRPEPVVPRQVRIRIRRIIPRNLLRRRLRAFLKLALNLAQPRTARFVPPQEGVPAQIAGARQHAVGMEARVLVQGDEVEAVRGAEDVAAVATVMTTEEEAE